MAETDPQEIGPDKTLLLVDDDEPFLRRLAKAMEKRGFEVETAAALGSLLNQDSKVEMFWGPLRLWNRCKNQDSKVEMFWGPFAALESL